MAQVYERDLGDDEAAIEGYRQALEFDPANAAALDALERLYTKLDRPAELLAVYERQLELTQDYRERVKMLFRSAAIWEERYQNLANADACIDAALQVDPQNLQAIKTLERLRKAQGRWEELVGVVDRHLQLLTLGDEKAELCVEMGDIFHQQLKAVDRAVTAYHQALELDPGCRPAMHALGTLYERSGNWPFALDMLEREAQVARRHRRRGRAVVPHGEDQRGHADRPGERQAAASSRRCASTPPTSRPFAASRASTSRSATGSTSRRR